MSYDNHKLLSNEGVYNRTDILSIFRIGSGTFQEWTKEGLVPLWKGKTHVYDGGEVREFLKKRREKQSLSTRTESNEDRGGID